MFCQLSSGRPVSMDPQPFPHPHAFRWAAGSVAHWWFELATTSAVIVVVAGMAVAGFVTTAIVHRVTPSLLDGQHWIAAGTQAAGIGATSAAAFFLGYAVMGGGGGIAAGCTVASALLWWASALVHPDTTTAS